MTQEQHPITPSDDHVKKWMRVGTMDIAPFHLAQSLCTQAARWGADQELDACISAVLNHPGFEQPELFTELLRDARRPKPLTDRQQSIALIHKIQGSKEPWHIRDLDVVLRASAAAIP